MRQCTGSRLVGMANTELAVSAAECHYAAETVTPLGGRGTEVGRSGSSGQITRLHSTPMRADSRLVLRTPFPCPSRTIWRRLHERWLADLSVYSFTHNAKICGNRSTA